MRLLQNIANKYNKTIENFEATDEEKRGWYHHACTQALVAGLTADSLELLLKMQAATHMSYDIDKSMMEHTRLLAELRRLEDVLEKIEAIRSNVSNEAVRP